MTIRRQPPRTDARFYCWVAEYIYIYIAMISIFCQCILPLFQNNFKKKILGIFDQSVQLQIIIDTYNLVPLQSILISKGKTLNILLNCYLDVYDGSKTIIVLLEKILDGRVFDFLKQRWADELL